MHCMGAAMGLKCHWVLLTIILYLVLNNAGGHGTDDCVMIYYYVKIGV